MKQRKFIVGTLLALCSLGLASCMNGALSSSTGEGSGDSSSPAGEHEHTFSDTWSHDENKHWHEATCGHDVRKSEGEHVFSLETEAADVARYICDVCGYEKSVDILSFTLSEDNKSYSVKGKDDCSSLPVSITIPGEHNGLPVNEIDPKAFASWNKLKSISIPNSIETIGGGTFSGCSSLTSIVIPDSVTIISALTFSGCESLSSVTLSKNLVMIEGAAFQECSALESITFPNTLEDIGSAAFDSCNKLKSISIPKSVESIEVGAFQYCALESITVENENSTYHSENNCLIETNNKTLVVGCKNSIIPTDGSVLTIGDSAFTGCELVSLIVPHSITMIEEDAFESAFDSTGKIYYEGSKTEWNTISKELNPSDDFSVLYYSETKPSEDGNHYWHYVDGVATEW